MSLSLSFVIRSNSCFLLAFHPCLESMPWAHGKIACNAPRQQYIIYNENYKHLLDTLDEFDGRSGHTASTAAATLTSIICNSSSFMVLWIFHPHPLLVLVILLKTNLCLIEPSAK